MFSHLYHIHFAPNQCNNVFRKIQATLFSLLYTYFCLKIMQQKFRKKLEMFPHFCFFCFAQKNCNEKSEKKSENLSHLFQCYKKSEKIIEGFSEAIFKVFLSRMVRLGQVERGYYQKTFLFNG